jgi:uncharacterized protein (TIGR02996 family)
MRHADGFLKDIVAHPDDDTPRLVFADWLDENGGAEGTARAEFIRAQCARATLPDDAPQRWELLERERTLLRQYGKHWCGPLRRFVKRWEFRRGFVEAVALRTETFLEHAEELFRLTPIRDIQLIAPERHLSDLAECPALRRLAGLNLSHADINVARFRKLAHSPRLRRLQRLGLRGTGLCSDAGVRFLSACENLSGLTALDVSDFRGDLRPGRRVLGRRRRREERQAEPISEKRIRALADSPYLKGLTALRIGGYGFGARDMVHALADSPLLERLHTLDLRHDHVAFEYMDPSEAAAAPPLPLEHLLRSPRMANLRELCLDRATTALYWEEMPDAFEALRDSPHVANLTVLYIGGAFLTGDQLGHLVKARHLTNLVELHLVGNEIDDTEAQALAGVTHWPRLRVLNLNENAITDKGLRSLAKGPLLAQLRVLSLQGHGRSHWRSAKAWVKDAGVRALAAAEQAAGLVSLDLGAQEIGDGGARALAGAGHLGRLVSLSLWHNVLTDKGADALAKSKQLAALANLDLRGNTLSPRQCSQLRRRFGYGVCYGPGPEPGRSRRPVRS